MYVNARISGSIWQQQQEEEEELEEGFLDEWENDEQGWQVKFHVRRSPGSSQPVITVSSHEWDVISDWERDTEWDYPIFVHLPVFC